MLPYSVLQDCLIRFCILYSVLYLIHLHDAPHGRDDALKRHRHIRITNRLDLRHAMLLAHSIKRCEHTLQYTARPLPTTCFRDRCKAYDVQEDNGGILTVSIHHHAPCHPISYFLRKRRMQDDELLGMFLLSTFDLELLGSHGDLQLRVGAPRLGDLHGIKFGQCASCVIDIAYTAMNMQDVARDVCDAASVANFLMNCKGGPEALEGGGVVAVAKVNAAAIAHDACYTNAIAEHFVSISALLQCSSDSG